MIYKFRAISNESDDFFRDIEIEDTDHFFSLHQLIQNSVNYDKSQIASFYTSNGNWEKLDEITIIDMSDFSKEKKYVMHKTIIKELVKKKKDKILYVFDFFSERAFFIELTDIHEAEKGKKYPRLVNGNGKAPVQIIEGVEQSDDFNTEISDEFNDLRIENIDDFSDM